MEIILAIVGALLLIVNIVAGAGSGSLLMGIAGGLSSGLIFFAFVKVLTNQDRIEDKIDRLTAQMTDADSRCENCGKEIAREAEVCPYCAHRKGQ